MPTTTTTTNMGRSPNDPQVRAKNNGLYWGIAAVALIVLAILFSMRQNPRDTVVPASSMSSPANSQPVQTAPVEQNSNMNAATTSETTQQRTETTTKSPAPTESESAPSQSPTK